MAGIFGYFSQEIDENRLNEIVNAIKAENYSITNQILNRSCFLSKLDIISSEVKASITKKEDKISIVTCGEIYNEDIENLDKSIITLYKEGRLERLKTFNGSFAAAIYDGAKDQTIIKIGHGEIVTKGCNR
jgi:asparagine synthetase B (glutamine-hydrolysing)